MNAEHFKIVKWGAKAITEWRSTHPDRLELSAAVLLRADLRVADLSQTTFGSTSITDVDLSDARGLATISVHGAPSSVGVDTRIRTFRGAGNHWTEDLFTFFVGAGVPRELLGALSKIRAEVKAQLAFPGRREPRIVAVLRRQIAT